MSYLPPGFDMAAEKARHNAILIEFEGQTVTYTPRGGSGYSLRGILYSGEEVQQGDKAYQTIWAPIGNFTAGEPRKGDTVVIGAITYRVGEPEKQDWDVRVLPLSVST